ncbi:MAG: type 1 glutamine amidotransferase [Clostridia bacterium]
MYVKIGHLYPDLMNLYGDRGNVIALRRRCGWRGIEVESLELRLGESFDFSECDILFMGGGQDREQELVWPDLQPRRGELEAAVEGDAVFLAVCGAYQLLGHHYLTPSGRRIPGLGILDVHTEAGAKRLIGNAACQSDHLPTPGTLVGFENHGGRTYLGSGCVPLARVTSGFGNNGEDGTEGAVYRNVFGTYLHGSLLPKNPHFADLLIGRALRRRYPELLLGELDDALEWRAHRAALRLAGARTSWVSSDDPQQCPI